MEVSLAKRLILSVSMHGGRYFFIQPNILCPSASNIRFANITRYRDSRQGLVRAQTLTRCPRK